MKLSLQVLSQGKASGASIPITLSQFLIGRDPQCHLRPASPLISKRHCALLVKGGKVFLRDFGSTNGTHINDEVIQQAERALKHDDLVQVGPLSFRVQIEADTPVDKPTPPPPKVKAQAEAASDDEAIAAMLLDLQDEAGAGSALGDTGPKAEDIPSGTTVMDVPSLPAEGAGAPAEKDKKEAAKKDSKGGATSASAAAALLAKYSRRNRS
jgi:pSer/pThr/pTyr-binding forkhead associated (FHA) protein